MSRRRVKAICFKCGKEFIPDHKHRYWCPTCKVNIKTKNDYRKTKKCPTCNNLIQPRHKTCRKCRWKPYEDNHICPKCGGPKTPGCEQCKECSIKTHIGVNSKHWKGGRYYTGSGYVMVYDPSHPRANKSHYVREHVKVWMATNGDIPDGYLIHHLNGIKSDNRLINLTCIPKYKHGTHTLIDALQERIKELENKCSSS